MKTKLGLAITGLAIAGMFAFTGFQGGSVKGTINPADGAVRAWALSATDTFRTDVVGGGFEIAGVKTGTYKVIIEAKPPYKNAAKDGVQVTDGSATNIGEIVLEK